VSRRRVHSHRQAIGSFSEAEVTAPRGRVQSVDGQTCGSLTAITGGAVAVQQGKSLHIIPLGRISRLEYAERCPHS
jgi:hypothetical protein